MAKIEVNERLEALARELLDRYLQENPRGVTFRKFFNKYATVELKRYYKSKMASEN
jgi:hypothetical protein